MKDKTEIESPEQLSAPGFLFQFHLCEVDGRG